VSAHSLSNSASIRQLPRLRKSDTERPAWCEGRDAFKLLQDKHLERIERSQRSRHGGLEECPYFKIKCGAIQEPIDICKCNNKFDLQIFVFCRA
jgi:hypothetical protein